MDHARRDLAVSLYRRLLEAWNARNADAFAALFAEDGSTVGFDGSMLNGRGEIASALRGIFASHPTAAYVAKVREVRELGPDVTLLRAVAGMIPPGKDELNPAVNAVQSMILVARDAESRIALFQNTPAAFHGRAELAERLTQELTGVLRGGGTVAAD